MIVLTDGSMTCLSKSGPSFEQTIFEEKQAFIDDL